MPGPHASRDRSLADGLAGLSVAGLLLPQSIAYAELANLPPQAGVLGLLAGLICYGLLGRSRFAMVSPTSSSAAVLAASTLALAADAPAQRVALAALVVIAAGVLFTVAGIARLGAISHLIARPVLRGYTFGLALVIAVYQWPQLVGLPSDRGSFAAVLAHLLIQLRAWQATSVALGIAALLILLALERLRRVPGTLLVIVAGIAGSGWLAAHGVALTGAIHLAPTLGGFVWPAGRAWLSLVENAIALMFILFAESHTSIRSFALRHDDPVQPNRDLVALGVANLVAGLLHGAPVGAGYSGTAANEAAGAQSRAAGLWAAAVVLALVLLLLRWIERIPQPILAAIVIHAVSKSLQPSVFRPYFRWHRDRLVALMALGAVLAFGVLDGLLAAIAFSVAMLLRSLASPRLSVLGQVGAHDFVSVAHYPRARAIAATLILRPEEPLFFANADALTTLIRQRVQELPDTRVLVLSLEESPDLDTTSLESIEELCVWLAARGIELRLARLKDASRDALLSARLPQLPSTALYYSSVDDAVSGRAVLADD